MSDVGRESGSVAEEDRLPWLEPVEDQTAEEGVPAGRLLAGLLVLLVALGLVVGGVYWLKQRVGGPGTASSDPTLIAAQSGPYKVKPDQPGGMDVKGQGDSSYAASEGADPNAKIDLSATPEAPIAKPGAAPAAAPASAPAAKPAVEAKAPVQTAKASTPAPAKAPAPVKAPAPKAPAAAPAKEETASAAPSGHGGQLQLGAFSSEAKANAAWSSLSGRFAYLASLSKAVVPVQVGDKTMYRLRASAGGEASTICSKLKVAGETCVVVG